MNNNHSFLETFGNYILLKKLAEGGMAEVFLARPASRDGNGRVLVVKRILPHIASHSVFLNMFQREIQIIMGFNHANTVQLHDFGSVDGQPYIAMEFIEGKNLREVLEKLKSKNHLMPVPMVLSLMAQAAAGLFYAHTFVNKITGDQLNAVHRDISPHNLIVSYEGNLKVIDFGIAKAACSVHDMTQTGMVKGKAAYFSPEQLAGGTVDARTDIFALGAVMWELLTGSRLFAKPGDSEITAMQRVSNCEKYVVPPSSINKEVPPEVDHIVMMALEKDPNERYQTAREMQASLRQTLSRLFPAYTYADTGKLMTAIFADEIQNERNQLRELNIKAQQALLGLLPGDDKTTTVTTQKPMGPVLGAVSANSGAFNVAKTNSRLTVPYEPPAMNNMDFRLSKIEAALKQKATGRHYAMLAFYIVSLVALKVSEHYEFSVDYPTANAQVVAETTPPPTASQATTTTHMPQAVQQTVQTAVHHIQPQQQPPSQKQVQYHYVPRKPAQETKKVVKLKAKKKQRNTRRQ